MGTQLEHRDSNQHALSGSAPEASSGISIRDILAMFAKRKWFILGCTVICTLIALAYVKKVTPIYEASASIRIDAGRASSLGFNDLLASVNGQEGADAIHTEIAVLQSDRTAIAALDSLSDSEFRRFTGKDKQTLEISPLSQTLTKQQEMLLGRFKNQLTVKQLEETQLVMISFRDQDPTLAADIVNHIVTAYLRQNFEGRYESVAQVTTWLSSQMQELRTRAADAQAKLAHFEETNNILPTGVSGESAGTGSSTSTTTNDRLRLLNDSLASAESNRIVKEAQMRAAASVTPAAMSSLFPNSELQALQTEQATLLTQYSQLSSKFGPGYSPLVEMKKQMQVVDHEVDRNVQMVRARMNEEYEAAKGSEDMLRSEYNEQTQKAYAANRQQAELAVLQAEGSSSRELYNTLQYKLQQAGIDAGLSGINTMPVDIARTPIFPVAPKKMNDLIFGAAFGLLISLGSILLIEALADKVQNVEQLQSGGNRYPVVTILHVPGKLESGAVTLREPLSFGAESYRKLRNSLLQSNGNRVIKTLMVASALPGEGKSTVASNLAIVLVQSGFKVLLIDADLRRPNLHQIFSVENGAGLADCLKLGLEAPWIEPTSSLPGLFLMTAGKAVENPSEILSGVKFRSVLDQWKTSFDYIVVKTAPLLLVSDSLPLANWADGVLLVTRQDLTPLKTLQQARQLLSHADAHLVGIAMNDVKALNHAYEAYGRTPHVS